MCLLSAVLVYYDVQRSTHSVTNVSNKGSGRGHIHFTDVTSDPVVSFNEGDGRTRLPIFVSTLSPGEDDPLSVKLTVEECFRGHKISKRMSF